MKNSRYWIAFAFCSLIWAIASLSIAPNLSGEDVYIFRDAGWNLAAHGRFESAALVQMHDLTPRLYAHYTPMMPLLFAAYAFVFPRNAYAGTVFNLLIGLAAAAVALRGVLPQPPGRLRTLAACAIAVLPVVFITYDRPEALALALCGIAIAFASRANASPVLAGALLAVTFLAHPFAAAAAAVWMAALLLVENWSRANRWTLTAGQVAIAAAVSVALIAPVAVVFYMLDHEALQRFAAHALGMHSGLGVAISSKPGGGFVQGLRKSLFVAGALETCFYVLSLIATPLLVAWAIFQRKQLHAAEWLPVAAAMVCAMAALFLFPAQGNYTTFIAFLTPVGLAISSRRAEKLAGPALALILFAVAVRLPVLSVSLIQRVEQIPSFRAAQSQPAFLRAQLASPDPVVVVEGESYDLFKPEFGRMIRLDEASDTDQYRSVAAVANCYDAFHGADGAVRPLPDRLNASDFRRIQPDPQHMWVTLFGRRAMRGQWGYGCDLYIRKEAPAGQTPGS